eukprot:SAG11_NODE_19924_length_456_cov_0.938375_1_plen_92_part_10
MRVPSSSRRQLTKHEHFVHADGDDSSLVTATVAITPAALAEAVVVAGAGASTGAGSVDSTGGRGGGGVTAVIAKVAKAASRKYSTKTNPKPC